MVKIAVKNLIDDLLSGLNGRQKEVIFGRFGLGENSQSMTLAAIGDKYGITRERVRQIEAAALSQIQDKIKNDIICQEIISKSKKYLQSIGGVAKEEDLISHLKFSIPGLAQNHLSLILRATGSFNYFAEDRDFNPFYHLDKKTFSDVNKTIGQLVNFLSSQKNKILAGNYENLVREFIKQKNINSNHLTNYISISKKISSNPYGESGLTEWAEINPQNIRDRIYLVLRKNDTPLHFREITNKINEINFNNKKALAPTVHNELIKDDRFVLVGRGIYGLKESGYEPGTVKDVITKILNSKGPMKPKDISLAVARERIVKPNTILVNLQNRKMFERLDDGSYRIKKA